jgi:hypothetical protein
LSLARKRPKGLREALKASKVIRTEEGKKVAEREVANPERVSLGTTPEPRTKSKGRLKTMIIGLGVVLIIIGIALAVYVATSEDDSVLIALGPAYIGVIVIIAALRGKVLRT